MAHVDSSAQAAQRRPPVVAGMRLVRLAGRGGEGEVWEARDAAGRRRALKLIRPEMLADPDEVLRRSGFLQRIDHPALVRVHSSGLLGGATLDGWGFVEMDYVDGEALSDAPADEAFPERLGPLAEALDLLHAGFWSDGVPLVHRDVKPANLVATRDGRIVLVDCSTLRGADTTELTRVGTPLFVAPEVMSGRFGPAADVYSFAVTVVALVTGARRDQLAEMLTREAARAMRTASPDHEGGAPQEHQEALARPPVMTVPEGVRAALSPDPARRPATCAAVLMAATEGRHAWHAATVEGRPAGSGARTDRAAEERPEWSVSRAPGTSHGPPLSRTPGDTHDPELWHAPAAGRALRPRTGPWPWLVVLAAVTAGVVASAVEIPGVPSRVALLAAVLVHLGAHVATGRCVAPAIALPPVAWAFLLAQRGAGTRRGRAWLRATLTGTLTIMVATGVVAATRTWGSGEVPVADDPAAVATAGMILCAWALVAVRMRALAGLAARLLLLPVWLAGAALLVAGGTVGLLVTVGTGQGLPTLRLIGGTIGSATLFVAGPPPPGWPDGRPA